MKDIFPSILLAIAMGICTYFVGLIDLPIGILVYIQIIVGGVFYVIASALLHIDSFEYLKGIAKPILAKIL